MKFEILTRLFNEENAVRNHREIFSQLGKKALIVTGRHSSSQNGSLPDVTAVLNEEKIPYVIFHDIEENPSIETIEKAASLGREEETDFVIGIGGGSPLDASKAIALLLANKDMDGSIFYKSLPLKAVPVIAVPTTCGTGSEVTPYAILTSHELKTKKSISYRIFPEYALVDFRYLKNAPLSLIRNTAADALSHCIESYLNANATDYSRMFSVSGMKLWAGSSSALISGQLETQDLKNLMTASTMAGMAISHTGTSLPHAMSYYLTYEKGIPHGIAVGTFLGAYLKACPDTKAVNFLLSNLSLSSVEEFAKMKSALLPAVTLSEAETSVCISNLLKDKKKIANCPYPVDEQLAKKLYHDSVVTS